MKKEPKNIIKDEIYDYFTLEEIEKTSEELKYMEEHPEEYKSYTDIQELKKDLLKDDEL